MKGNRKFLNTEVKCKKVLLKEFQNDFVCFGCGFEKYYYSNYYRICKNCKTKISVTHNTIFHNVRFGLPKAFNILLDYWENQNTISINLISKKYKISRKTVRLFIKRIEKTNDLESIINKVKRVNYVDNSKSKTSASKSNVEKLKAFLKKEGKF